MSAHFARSTRKPLTGAYNVTKRIRAGFVICPPLKKSRDPNRRFKGLPIQPHSTVATIHTHDEQLRIVGYSV